MQVESDIAPYKGLLLGLFFMSVGMEISGSLFVARWKEVLAGIVLLIGGKLAIVAAVGPMFGLSRTAAIRAGLLIAPGGEFAFVAFGEAVAKGVLPAELTSVLYLVVALSMAFIPYLAMLGGTIGKILEKSRPKTKAPDESETKELENHVIIAGYGRSGQLIHRYPWSLGSCPHPCNPELKNHVIIAGYGRCGQLIAQLLSENRIPFVAVDTQAEIVAKGKDMDLPVYFGDAGSPSVMHHLGAERASCALIALNTPGANYRVVWALTKHYPNIKTFVRVHDLMAAVNLEKVWALTKHYPNIKTFVRAHDLIAAVNLEKAGATAVVPETLEPSLQLVAAALGTMQYKNEDKAGATAVVRETLKPSLQLVAAAVVTVQYLNKDASLQYILIRKRFDLNCFGCPIAQDLEKTGTTHVVPETLEPSLQLVAAAVVTIHYRTAQDLEKAGATAVVRETLKPSPQLVAASLGTVQYKNDDVAKIINEYRRKHQAELQEMTQDSGTTAGYHGIAQKEKGKDAKKNKKEEKDKKSTSKSTPSAPPTVAVA
eukprot:gene10069-7965_t